MLGVDFSSSCHLGETHLYQMKVQTLLYYLVLNNIVLKDCEAVVLQSSDSVVTINDVFVLTFDVCVVMSSCGVLL